MSNLPNFPTIRPSLLLDFANSKQVDPRIAVTRASTATYFDANWVLRSAASGVPRIDHDPTTGECKGLLIEEARTNLLTYSEQFDNAAWIKTRSTITANAATAPDGTMTADKLVEDATASSSHFNYQNPTVTDNTVYCHSVFAKAGERSNVVVAITDKANVTYGRGFNLTTGSSSVPTGINSSTYYGVAALQNGWYRCWVAHNVGSGATANAPRIFVTDGVSIAYTGDGTSGLYIWGAQLEAGAFPTSYIPTTSAAATRASDAASMSGTNFSEWYRQDEGMFVIEGSTSDLSASRGLWAVGDPTLAFGSRSSIYSSISATTGGWLVSQAVNGVSQITPSAVTGNFSAGVARRTAYAYKSNDSVGSNNGAIGTPDNLCDVPYTANFGLSIGNLNNGWSAGATYLNGHIKLIAYYSKRLTNAELQAITA